MKLLLKNHKAKLLANHLATIDAEGEDLKHEPVIKFFNPVGAATWLISGMDENGVMFGLCDLGFGTPELGSVLLSELEETPLPFGLSIERDMYWTADKTLTEYAAEARELGGITA